MIENKEKIDTKVDTKKDKKEIDECRNAVDLLLSMDADMVKMPVKTKDIYCEKFGMTLPMECRAIGAERFEKLLRSGYKIKDGVLQEYDSYKMKINVILETYPMLKEEALLSKFNAATPKELAHKLFLNGDITRLHDFACEVNGCGDKDIEEEIKN